MTDINNYMLMIEFQSNENPTIDSINQIYQTVESKDAFITYFKFMRNHKKWFMEYLDESLYKPKDKELSKQNKPMELIHKNFVKLVVKDDNLMKLVNEWLGLQTIKEDNCFETLLLAIVDINTIKV